jgi:hypothetical protein
VVQALSRTNVFGKVIFEFSGRDQVCPGRTGRLKVNETLCALYGFEKAHWTSQVLFRFVQVAVQVDLNG